MVDVREIAEAVLPESHEGADVPTATSSATRLERFSADGAHQKTGHDQEQEPFVAGKIARGSKENPATRAWHRRDERNVVGKGVAALRRGTAGTARGGRGPHDWGGGNEI
jgi:hypothetical protein